ncbi:MAG: 3-deoxy-7-phosphoheptulonate synthase [Synergistales bacterium]|nr:3-deoxy-7-phosphoheptulonate synthase [Synergistales bacterium]
MIVVQMKDHCSSLDIARVCDHQERRGGQVRVVSGPQGPCVVSDGAAVDKSLGQLPSVKSVSSTKSSYPMASLEVFGPQKPLDLGRGITIGGGKMAVMAGPCSVESREQLLETAKGVASSGASVLRGGAFKPRSNPYSFQGMGVEGIDLLKEAREETGLPIVTEVMSPEDVEWLAPQVDILQVGTRSMQNFPLLKALGKVRTPVLLKRGMSATVEEWLQAAEYILAGGNSRVILCERGIRSFDKSTRNTLDLSVIPLVKSMSHLPVIVDPSHATGRRDLVAPMCMAALAAGADGLIVEVHSRPEEALCDGPQSLDLPAFDHLMGRISRLMEALEPEATPWSLKVAM